MKKRFLAFLLTALLLLSCIAPAGALAETRSAWVKMPNKGGSLHLRAGTSKTSASVGYVQDGDSITVYTDNTGTDSEGERWVQVKLSRTGKLGYIKTKYISYDGSSSSSSSGTTVWVSSSGGSLRVRSGPGTSFSTAGYVKHGASISVLELGGTWSKIKVSGSGVTGYIKTKYIAGKVSSGSSGGSSSGGSSSGGSSSSLPSGYDLASVMTKTAFGSVNLRSGAGTGYGVVTSLSRGARLAVLGKSGDWYKVQTTSGKSGYISKTYVAFGVSGRTTANVNFRKGAGTGYGVIRQLKSGTAVTVHSISGKWANITAGGSNGYIHTSYLKLS